MRNQRLAPTTYSSAKSSTMQQEPQLSGAYIRSLVKHLSSSSTTRYEEPHHINTMSRKPHSQPQQQEQRAAPQKTPPPPPKKQVRRRLHTSRPYQERLLNMSEARREIVTALKIHRASMRKAKEEEEQQLMQQLQDQQDVQVVQDQIRVAWSAPMSSYALSYSDYLHNTSPSTQFTATSSSCSYYSSPLPSNHTSVASAPMVPMVDALDHLMPLPAQPLGLNLSLHGFGSVVAGQDDMNAHTGSFDPPLLLQPSPTSSYSVYSSSPPAATMANHDVSSTVAAAENTSLHWVLDDEEMAAICSAGERHDIEWSDTVNLASSAWWSKLLQSVEGDRGAVATQQRADGSNAVGALSDEYYGEDVSLPIMDIGEIQGWDSEWLL